MGYVLVGTSATFVLGENSNRTYASFVNNSSNKIHLKLGYGATVNEGITLNANGGSYEITLTNPYHGVVTAVAEAGSNNSLAVNELSKE